LKLHGPIDVYAAWYLYDVFLFYLDAIDREPGRSFADPLIERMALLADRWLAQWPRAHAEHRYFHPVGV
jgi:hypothetical protein